MRSTSSKRVMPNIRMKNKEMNTRKTRYKTEAERMGG